jgi:hypothetical protein
MSETNYLKLKYITLMSTRWFQDFNSNLARLDLLGKHIRIQQGAGQSMAIRAELSDGTLVEPIRAVPNSNSGVDLYLGRPQSGDRVIIQAPTGGIGTRVTATGITLAQALFIEGTWVSTSGSVTLPAGTWDVDAQAALKITIATPATPHPQAVVLLGLFAAGAVLPLATAVLSVDLVTAVDATLDFYETAVFKALGVAGGTSYTLKATFYVLGASFVQGDGTAVSIGLSAIYNPQNILLATRVA